MCGVWVCSVCVECELWKVGVWDVVCGVCCVKCECMECECMEYWCLECGCIKCECM